MNKNLLRNHKGEKRYNKTYKLECCQVCISVMLYARKCVLVCLENGVLYLRVLSIPRSDMTQTL